MNLGINRGLVAAMASLGTQAFAAALNGTVGPDPVQPYVSRFRGHTQGASRNTEHKRRRNRLTRKARRVERLHRHTATGKRLRFKQSHAWRAGYAL